MPRRRWQDDLSVDRRTPDEILMDDLRQQRLQQQIAQHPLENELKELQLLRAQGELAKQKSELANDIETQRQKNAYFSTMPDLDAQLASRGVRPGSLEYAQAMVAIREKIPLGASDKEVSADLLKRSKVADVEAAFQSRMRELAPAPEKIAERYAKVQGGFKQFSALVKQDMATQTASGKTYNPIFDEKSSAHAAGFEGFKAEKAQLEKDYPHFVQPTPTPTPSAAAAITAPATEAAGAAVATPAPKRFKYNPETGDLE